MKNGYNGKLISCVCDYNQKCKLKSFKNYLSFLCLRIYSQNVNPYPSYHLVWSTLIMASSLLLRLLSFYPCNHFNLCSILKRILFSAKFCKNFHYLLSSYIKIFRYLFFEFVILSRIKNIEMKPVLKYKERNITLIKYDIFMHGVLYSHKEE